MMPKGSKVEQFSILGLKSKGAKFGQATLLHAYWPVNLSDFGKFT